MAADSVHVVTPAGDGPFVLTCEHASCVVPTEYEALGLTQGELEDHIGWDIGAAEVTRRLSSRLAAPAVLAGVSRLVIDCNRDLAALDCIVADSHGVVVPGNQGIGVAERNRRVRRYYEPFHRAIDDVLGVRPAAFLLSIHSFTPVLRGWERKFDVGVLYDRFEAEARWLGGLLAEAGFAVRYNEPYSAMDGLIYSAQSHGRRHGIRYLEIELNNRLLRREPGLTRVSAAVGASVERFQERACG